MSRRSDMTQLSERDRRPRREATPQLRQRSEAAPREPASLQPQGDAPRNLQQSLTSTDAGLKNFLTALRDSGLPDAIPGYREMQMVLVQQRLWAHSNRRSELIPLFQSIARTAGELHRIFAGFAEVLRPLQILDKLTRMTGLDPEASPLAEAAADPPTEAAAPPPADHPAEPAGEQPAGNDAQPSSSR